MVSEGQLEELLLPLYVSAITGLFSKALFLGRFGETSGRRAGLNNSIAYTGIDICRVYSG